MGHCVYCMRVLPQPQGQVPPEEFGPDPYYYGEEYWGWESDPFAGPPLPVSHHLVSSLGPADDISLL